MSKTKERIRESQLEYKHGLGQNFIYDEGLLAALVEASGVGPEDDVLEIGPGTGTLTRHLCAAVHRVLSLELDERLIPLLRAFMESQPNFEAVQGDAMTADLAALTEPLRKPFQVVSNIPYYITTPLIQRLLDSGLPLKSIALMVQREVADKILAQPGDPGWGPLAIRCQMRCEPRLAMPVPAACFTPVPKVDSAFVVMPLRQTPPVAPRSEKDFDRVVQAAFALRRKTLANALMATLRLSREDAAALVETAQMPPLVRGERLGLEEFARVADAYTAWKEAHP
ncbi:MAG: ribosomal RNA small subunit methyltransferase A [Clostridia bacterium]|nr:ribosomal RNA small subunit methyltransferase A [Clostridia bacterium]